MKYRPEYSTNWEMQANAPTYELVLSRLMTDSPYSDSEWLNRKQFTCTYCDFLRKFNFNRAEVKISLNILKYLNRAAVKTCTWNIRLALKIPYFHCYNS